MKGLGELSELADTIGALGDQELITEIVGIVHAENAVTAARLVALAEIDRRGLGMKMGSSSAARWWARSINVTDYKAVADVELGHWLGAHPRVLSAMSDGPLDRDHAAAVRDGLVLVATADPELDLTDIETELLELALRDKPSAVIRRAEAIALPARQAKRAREQKKYDEEQAERRRREEDEATRRAQNAGNPDPIPMPDPTPDPTPPPPRVPPAEDTTLNTFSFFTLPNGRIGLKGDFDKLTAEQIRSHVHPLTKPGSGPAGDKDTRSPARRNADAVSHLFARGFGTSGFIPNPAMTLLTVSLAELTVHEGTGCAPSESAFDLHWTGPVSQELAKLITCNSDLVPIIVDDAGVPLAMGRRVRVATEEQRWAVYVRDKCCVNCGKDKQWCQVHHMTFWENDGLSDIGNFALLCTDCHHRLVHHGGWEVVPGDDGHPWMIPPPTVDPEREPIPSHHRRHEHRRQRRTA